MKKIAMLLALALCLMMAATAMADFTIPADVTGAGHEPLDYREEYLDEWRLSFASECTYLRDDCINDLNSTDLPFNENESALVKMFEEAMLKELQDVFGGESFNYMFFDVEAETKIKAGDQMFWAGIDVPMRSNGDSQFWAKTATGVVPMEYFGGKVGQVAAVYGKADLSATEGFRILPVKSVKVVDGGVEMTFDHLSPVMIAWTNKPVAAPLAAPEMPSTGDNSSLPGLFILLGMSLAAFGAMKLRRRES